MAEENKKIAFSLPVLITVIGAALAVTIIILLVNLFAGEDIKSLEQAAVVKEEGSDSVKTSQSVNIEIYNEPALEVPPTVVTKNSNEIDAVYKEQFAEALSFFENKKFLDAAAVFSDLSDNLEVSNVTVDNYLSASYYGVALKEFENENYDDTIYYMDKAFAVTYPTTHEANYYRTLANAKYKTNRLSEAISDMQELKSRAQNNFNENDKKFLSDLYFIKAKESYRDGDTESALSYITEASTLQPNSEPLNKFLLSLKTQSKEEEGFISTSTSRFNIKFEGGENEVLGYEISLMLDEIYYKIGNIISYYPPGMTSVILYSKQDFFDLTGSPTWSGGIYDGQIKMPIGGLKGSLMKQRKIIESVLSHEFSHVIVYKLAKGKSPVWFNEGIAQYFEGKRAGDIFKRQGMKYRKLSPNNNYDLKRLEGSFLNLKSDDVSKAYFLSLAAVEYIIDRHGIYEIREILTLLGKGYSMEKALKEALYIDYNELNGKFLEKYK